METLAEAPSQQPTGPTPIVGYYHPNVSLALVMPSGPINYATLPPVTKQRKFTSAFMAIEDFDMWWLTALYWGIYRRLP